MTRYEITVKHSDGRAFLIGYTPRVSRIGLLQAMQKHGPAIIEKCGVDENCSFGDFKASPRPHVTDSNGWWFGFTGRTQNDARTTGELPFIAA